MCSRKLVRRVKSVSNVVDEHIGNQLKRLRKNRGMTIEDLARVLDTEAAEIEMMEAGKRIGARDMMHICTVLEVGPSVFFEDLYSTARRTAPTGTARGR